MPNSSTHSLGKGRFASVAILVTILVAAFTGGCGVRKAPRPPAKKTPQTAEVTVLQRGTSIQLQIALPKAARSGGANSLFSRADVYRYVRVAGKRTDVDESEFASKSSLIGSIDIDSGGRTPSEVLRFTDPDSDFTGQRVTVGYAVRLIGRDGQRLPFSNIAVITPEGAIAVAPTLSEPTVTQNHILVKWIPPTSTLDGNPTKSIVGYNVYRGDGGNPKRLITKVPAQADEYLDDDFEFGTTYLYSVRTVSLNAIGTATESDESKEVTVRPVDTFAPAPPTAITLAASPKTISLFFASNLEKDIAGYRIFRSEDQDRPLSEWTERTPSPIKKTTFIDDSVEPGKTYYYYVIAIDEAGNRSQPSIVVSESVPNI